MKYTKRALRHWVNQMDEVENARKIGRISLFVEEAVPAMILALVLWVVTAFVFCL